MGVIIRADRANKSGAGRIGGLQRHLSLVKNAEDIGKVLAVEGNLGLVAFHRGVNLADVVADSLRARAKMGVVPQEIALYPTLTARDNLVFWGRMYGLPDRTLTRRVDELLEVVQRADGVRVEAPETLEGSRAPKNGVVLPGENIGERDHDARVEVGAYRRDVRAVVHRLAARGGVEVAEALRHPQTALCTCG